MKTQLKNFFWDNPGTSSLENLLFASSSIKCESANETTH